MYLGRFISGDEVPLTLLADGGGGTRVQPGSPAAWSTFSADGTPVEGGLMPAMDEGRTPGLFRAHVRLGAFYPDGRYLVRCEAVGYAEVSSFDVVPGGHPDGQVVSHFYVARPAGDAILRKTDAGKRYIGRRPSP